MTKPWLETWKLDEPSERDRMTHDGELELVFPDGRGAQFGEPDYGTASDPCHVVFIEDVDLQRARFIASAPALARALCLVEFPGGICRACGHERRHGIPVDTVANGEGPDACPLDAALTAAGLDAAAREEVRRAAKG